MQAKVAEIAGTPSVCLDHAHKDFFLLSKEQEIEATVIYFPCVLRRKQGKRWIPRCVKSIFAHQPLAVRVTLHFEFVNNLE